MVRPPTPEPDAYTDEALGVDDVAADSIRHVLNAFDVKVRVTEGWKDAAYQFAGLGRKTIRGGSSVEALRVLPIPVFSLSKAVTGFVSVITMTIFERHQIKDQFAIDGFSPQTTLDSLAYFRRAVREERECGQNLSGGLGKVAIGQILTHTGGFPLEYGPLQTKPTTDFDVFRGLLRTFKGESVGKFMYGTGYDVVGCILVELWKASGLILDYGCFSEYGDKQPAEWNDLNDVVKYLLFRPLGITNSFFRAGPDVLTPAGGLRRIAMVTAEKWKCLCKCVVSRFVTGLPDAPVGGGSTLVTTLADYGRFIKMLLRKRNGFLSQVEFDKYCLTNHMNLMEDATTKAPEADERTYGHSLIGAGVAMHVVHTHRERHLSPTKTLSLNDGIAWSTEQLEKDARLLKAWSEAHTVSITRPPEQHERGELLYWGGLIGSCWHVDFKAGVAFTKMAFEPRTLPAIGTQKGMKVTQCANVQDIYDVGVDKHGELRTDRQAVPKDPQQLFPRVGTHGSRVT